MLKSHYRNPSLQKLKNEYDSTKEYFDLTKKRWNQLIRNFLTKSMGVSLTEGENRHQIQVIIKPAQDESFMEMIETNFPGLDFEEYHVLSQFLNASDKAGEYFEDAKARHQLSMAVNYAQYRLSDFNILEISENVFEFLKPGNPDVFGCYFINDSRVELYVFPIVLFCQLHGLHLESFIVMVLAHELAHGYNHIGRDKDGEYWKSFMNTDDYLAEGLAQYYTQRFLKQYQHREVNLLTTFERTIDFQPEAYSIFQEWDATLEQVYRAFIEARRNDLNSHQEFKEVLDNSVGTIGAPSIDI